MKKIPFVLALLLISSIAKPQNNTFVDLRDGSLYKTVTIAGKIWLAENLKFKTTGSWCYKELDLSCQSFGRLYTWEAALHACPEGWRLPKDDDFENLFTFYNGDKNLTYAAFISGGNSGFEALMAGRRNCEGEYDGLLQNASFWLSGEKKKKNGNCLEFYSQEESVFMSYDEKCSAKQVRCIKKE